MTRRATMPWLKDTRVTRVGDSTALILAGAALAQLGATVDSVRTLADIDPDVDVVLVDRIEAPLEVPGTGNSGASRYLDHVQSTNRSVWVTASAYGLTGDRADAHASDLTLLAAGGILGHSRIGDEFAPTVPPGTLGLKLVGHVVATAALHGLHALRAAASPVHADVSAQSALISTGLTLEMAHALSRCPDEGGSARYGAPSGFVDCLNGAVYVLVLEEHQWRAFRGVIGDSLETIATLEDARANADFVNAQLRTWASTRTTEDCEKTLQGAGVPCTAVNSLAMFTERSRAIGRDFDLTGPDLLVLPAQVFEGDQPAVTRPMPTPSLSDLRVLDAGHVLAVPLAGAWLGAMGAQVSKLEDLGRLDVYRRRGPFVDGVRGPNRSAYFNQLNFCKEQLELMPGGGVDLDAFDIVIENLSDHRARAIGIGADAVLAHSDPKLLLASSGFGRTGDWAGYRAYGHNIHAFAGLVGATEDARGGMGDIGTPWADPLTSVVLTTWALAWCLADSHATTLALDISMAELVAVQIAELAAEDAADPYTPTAMGAEFFLREPSTGRLIAVSLRDDEQRAKFEVLAGALLPHIDRRAPEIGWPLPALADTGATEVVNLLQRNGLAASIVHTSTELANDEFVRSTGLYRTINSAAVGSYEVTGLPWTLSGRTAAELRPAPEVPAATQS